MAAFGPIADTPIAAFPGSNIISGSIAESMAVTDSISAGGTIPCTIAESVAITDVYTVTGAFVAAIAETLATSDVFTGGATYPVSISESAVVSDGFVGGTTFHLTIAEIAALSDAYSATHGTQPAEQLTEGWWRYFYTDLIVWIAYDPSNLLLEINFTDGTERTFSGVPFGIAQAFVTAADPDNYYNNAIKNNYTRVFAS